jgi:hypothetical protein
MQNSQHIICVLTFLLFDLRGCATDALESVPNAVSKFRETPLFRAIDNVIVKFAGVPPSSSTPPEPSTPSNQHQHQQQQQQHPQALSEASGMSFSRLANLRKKKFRAKQDQVAEAIGESGRSMSEERE